LKKSPTGPAFTKGPLKNKTGITSNHKGFTFIADNSMNRLICLRWISNPQRKENLSREAQVAPLRTQPKCCHSAVAGTLGQMQSAMQSDTRASTADHMML
jgi:hypothetical protein